MQLVIVVWSLVLVVWRVVEARLRCISVGDSSVS